MNTHIATIAMNEPEELDAFVKQLNNRIIAAQHKHTEETIETLERRLSDMRSSLEYAKSRGKEFDLECGLSNIISAATTAIARCPKTIDAFDAYLAIRSEN